MNNPTIDGTETRSSVRVLVVDDQQLIRDGIASLLSIQDHIVVVGTAVNGEDALQQARALHPDVILMDVRMPVMDGITATVIVNQELPECCVLMLTTFDDEEYIVEALRAGAVGYLLKDMPDQDLAQAIHSAHRRIYQMDQAVAHKVLAALTTYSGAASKPAPAPTPRPTAAPSSTNLSERELDVVRHIARGSTNREIAGALVISEGTVKSHISNILSRLGLRDRTQIALYARDEGLLRE
jgi:DNA-binding NarL/FixJ family response regulator